MNNPNTSRPRLLIPTLYAAVVCAVALLPAAAHANLIVNGDFEGGDLGSWNASGAVVAASRGGYVANAFASGSFPVGNSVAAFGSGNQPATGVLSQDFATVAGGLYVLRFDYGTYGWASAVQAMQTSLIDVADGTTLATLDIADPSGTSVLGDVLSPYSQSFVAAGEWTRLSFRDLSVSTNSTDGVLDNVVVEVAIATVPEPTTGVLLLLAGAMAVAARRTARKG
jgi:hypothetical protein